MVYLNLNLKIINWTELFINKFQEDLIKENDLVSLEELSNATRFINESGLIYETPLISISPEILGLKDDFNLYLKLENMQNNGIIQKPNSDNISKYFAIYSYLSGSFKIRGVVNQFSQLNFDENEKLVTFSAGNYGKSFAYVCSKRNLNGKIILPNTVSEIKVNYITVKHFNFKQ